MSNAFEIFFKINGPTGRAKFFKCTICIALLQLMCSLFFVFMTEKVLGIQSIFWFPLLFSIIIILPLLYLYFVQYVKRLWDITAKNRLGVIAGSIAFAISVICMVAFPILTLAIYLTLILLPGKIVNE